MTPQRNPCRLLLAAILLAGPVFGADPEQHFDISAGPAEETLQEFSQQAGVELAYSSDQVRDVRTNAVHGAYPPSVALQELVANTPLVVVNDAKPGAYAVRRVSMEGRNGEGSSAAGIPTAPDQPSVGAPGNEVVQLTPFDVRADRNNSYSALNSTSITSFNTELNKMPLSADIFDQAFMNDVGATSVEQLLTTYSAGAGFSGADPGTPATREPGDHTSHSWIQLRGFTSLYMERDSLMPVGSFYNPGSTGSDFTSNFDLERVEVIDGPQAMLYTGGGGGGVVNVVSKQARFDQPTAGTIKFQIDQYGSKMGQLDVGAGSDRFAVRVALIQQDHQTRRVGLGGSLEGYYAQIAVQPFKNTVIRITAEQTTYNQVISSDAKLTASSTSADSRNGDYLKYLLAVDQTGGNTLNAAGQSNNAGPIDNGLVNWGDVDSYAGNVNSDLTVNTWVTASADTQWTSWLSTRIQAGYDDFYYDFVDPGISYYAPQSSSNPLGVWAAGTTFTDETQPGRAKAIRALGLITNDLFGGRVHSQTNFGADFLRQDAAMLDYAYYQADANWNVLVTPGATTNNGRTQMPKLYWSIANGVVPYPIFGARTARVTVGGVNYVRQLQDEIDPNLITPANPLGTTNSNTYAINKTFNSGIFLMNNTQWMDGKLDTLAGIRHADVYAQKSDQGNANNSLGSKAFDFDVGANYALTSELRAYLTASNTYDPPEAITHSPDGSLPLITHSIGEEVGLKFNNPAGTLSGSLALYHAQADNEQFELSTTVENDIAPTGLNGTPDRGQWVDVNRKTNGVQLVLTSNPTPNWRLRFSAAETAGRIGNTVVSPQLYSDQFYENSAGDVTYADGTIVYVPATYNSKSPTTTVGTAGAMPLTVALMNNPASPYYANPVNPTGQISSSSAVAEVLKSASATHGPILTGAIGLPISDLQITPPFAVPGQIVEVQTGDKTLGYPQLSANLTAVYTVSSGWLKGFSVGGTASVGWDYGMFYYYPQGFSNSEQRTIYSAPDMARFDLILGYVRKLRRFTFSSQLNVYNLLNHYDVLIYPDEVTGWSTTVGEEANFFGQPRAYVWTNSITF